MSTEEAIQLLKNCQSEAINRYHARIKAVFGSRVRGQPASDSDLDILVDFSPEADLFDLVALSDFLQAKLHCTVDLVPINSIRKELKDQILTEAIYL